MHFNTMTSMSKARMGDTTSGRPQKVGSYSSNGRTNLNFWIKLAEMKESHPVEVAEYARARGINKEPVFEWWVPQYSEKEASHLSITQEENQEDNTQVWY